MVRRVTITGTRSIEHLAVAQLVEVFEAYVRPFTEPDAHFYLGGAAGIDTSALEWLAEHTQVATTIVVPCTLADQPAQAAEAVSRWSRRGRVTEVVELEAAQLGSSAYHARNRWMVDHSTFVIGFPHGDDPSSGTWYTLNYAAGQGKPRLVVPV